MSKVSFSRELLGVVRFVFDPTQSRTLNATQAYDKSPSQIVLASYPATASKKPSKNRQNRSGGVVSFTATTTGDDRSGGVIPITTTTTGDAIDIGFDLSRGLKSTASVNLNFFNSFGDSKSDGVLKADKVSRQGMRGDTAIFGGMTITRFGGMTITRTTTRGVDPLKSNTTKDIYYGAMTVATGLYRDWQGKYAVLKVDLLTNNAILRVYNS
jgi:hypothetical protein